MARVHGLRYLRLGWFAVVATCGASSTFAGDLREVPQLRRPVALAVQGDRLWVANRRSGSLSLVDLPGRKVIGEHAIGKQLEDVTAIPGGAHLLVADSGGDQLLLVDGQTARVMERLTLPADPVQVRVAADGSFCSVTSLWAHQVSLIDLAPPDSPDSGPRLRLRAKIDLPFAPRCQWLARDGLRLVVADGFGGRLAVIDPTAARVLAVRTFDGHNLSGIAADADERELLVSHQLLNEAVPTTRDRVFWGTLMGNVVRSIPLADLLSIPEDGPLGRESRVYDLAHWSLHPLGRPGAATGDPGAIAVTRDGKTVIALAGVGEVAYRSAPLQPFYQRQVGRRPSAIALDDKRQVAFIANKFDDSLSVLDLESGEVTDTIPLGRPGELTAADRGEIMFYDARFSLDGWYSCHSCHTDGHSNGLLNDNLSDEAFGASKRVLSLLGVGDTGPWTWSGEQESLQEQAHKSTTITMRDHEGMHATEENMAALTAYMQTLSPPPSLLAARGQVNEQERALGERVFAAQGCVECHRPPTYTTPSAYDVGLEDAAGRREFNPPSLRGVSQRPRLFHDNRAGSLEDVLVKHRHGDVYDAPPEDLKALLTFLRSL